MGTLTNLTTINGGITWTATLTPSELVALAYDNVVTLDLSGITDLAGNAGSGTADSDSFAISAIRPTVGIVVSDAALLAGETSLVTLTFSEAVTGLTNDDLTIANGTLTAVGSTDGGTVWTATFTPTSSVTAASNVITLSMTAVTNAAGNTGSGTTDSNSYAVDTSAPSVTSVSVPSDGTYGIGQDLTFTVNWSEAATVTGTPRLALTIRIV